MAKSKNDTFCSIAQKKGDHWFGHLTRTRIWLGLRVDSVIRWTPKNMWSSINQQSCHIRLELDLSLTCSLDTKPTTKYIRFFWYVRYFFSIRTCWSIKKRSFGFRERRQLFSVLVTNLHMPVSCQTGFNAPANRARASVYGHGYWINLS